MFQYKLYIFLHVSILLPCLPGISECHERGMWDEDNKPKAWPANVPFKDPNNSSKKTDGEDKRKMAVKTKSGLRASGRDLLLR